MATEDLTLPPLRVGLTRLALKIGVILVAAYAIHMVMDWATLRAEAQGSDTLMVGVLTVLLLAYALLIAVPFMPGIEVGISLLMLKGAAIAPLVYAATVLGLIVAYAAGRLIPQSWLRGVLADLRLKRACLLVDRLAPMSRQERLDHLTSLAPRWLRPAFRSWRYLLLAGLLNLPGNAVIGGGGGIAFIAGFSRLFRPIWTIMIFLLAVLPVPLLVWGLGSTGALR